MSAADRVWSNAYSKQVLASASLYEAVAEQLQPGRPAWPVTLPTLLGFMAHQFGVRHNQPDSVAGKLSHLRSFSALKGLDWLEPRAERQFSLLLDGYQKAFRKAGPKRKAVPLEVPDLFALAKATNRRSLQQLQVLTMIVAAWCLGCRAIDITKACIRFTSVSTAGTAGHLFLNLQATKVRKKRPDGVGVVLNLSSFGVINPAQIPWQYMRIMKALPGWEPSQYLFPHVDTLLANRARRWEHCWNTTDFGPRCSALRLALVCRTGGLQRIRYAGVSAPTCDGWEPHWKWCVSSGTGARTR